MDERAFYKESQTTKPLTLTCPFCRGAESYDLKWVVRTKVDRLPGNADERDRAKFKKAASYMVLLDDKVIHKEDTGEKGWPPSIDKISTGHGNQRDQE